MWTKIAVIMIVISSAHLLPVRMKVSDDYEIKNGTYYSYVECLGDPVENVSVLQSRAARVLTETSLEEIWLPLQRRHLGGWFWLTGQFHDAKLSREAEKFGRDCGVLRSADSLLDDTMCNNPYRKYLCQHQGESCPRSIKTCLSHNGRTYWLNSGSEITWYDARTRCTQQGQQLSTLPKESRNVVMKWLQASISSFYDVWIGLRRSDYFIVGHDTPIDIFQWMKTDTCPCESRDDCVIQKRRAGNTFSWLPQSCNTTKPYICSRIQKDDFTQKPSKWPYRSTEIKWTSAPNLSGTRNCSSVLQLDAPKLATSYKGFKTALIIISIGVVLMTVGITIYCFMYHCRYPKRNTGQDGNRNKSTKESDFEEREHLKEILYDSNNGYKDQTVKELNLNEAKRSQATLTTLVSEDIKDLEKTKEDLTNALKSIKHLKAEKKKNQDEIKKLSQENENFMREQNERQRSEEENDSITASLKSQIECLTCKLQEAEQNSEDLQSEYSKKEKHINEFIGKIESLENKLKKAEEKNEMLEIECSNKEKFMKELQISNAQLARARSANVTKLSDLKKANAEAEDSLKAMKTVNQQLKMENYNVKSENQALKKKLSSTTAVEERP